MSFMASPRLIGAAFVVALGFFPSTAHAEGADGVTPVTLPPAPTLTVPTLSVPTLPAPQTSSLSSPATGSGSLTVPTVSVPQLSVPSLGSSGGSVTVPTITVPELRVPTLAAPTLSVPQLEVPQLSVPSLTVPPLVAPEMPTLVVPQVPVTSVTSLPTTGPRDTNGSAQGRVQNLPQGGLIAPEVLLDMLRAAESDSVIELTPPQDATSARRLPIGTFALGGAGALFASFVLSAARRRRETLAGEPVE